MPIFQLIAIFAIAYQVPYLATTLAFLYACLGLFFFLVLLFLYLFERSYFYDAIHQAAIDSRARSTFTIWSSIITSSVLVGLLLVSFPISGAILGLAMLGALYIHTYA